MRVPEVIDNIFTDIRLNRLVEELGPYCSTKQSHNVAIRGLFGDTGTYWEYNAGVPVYSQYWPAIVLPIKDIVSRKFNRNFNSATGYIYQDGGTVYPHSDFRYIKNVAGDSVIVCSFGADRIITFTTDAGIETKSLLLKNGSVLIIPRDYDECHLHKVDNQPGLRVSLTFRELLINENYKISK